MHYSQHVSLWGKPDHTGFFSTTHLLYDSTTMDAHNEWMNEWIDRWILQFCTDYKQNAQLHHAVHKCMMEMHHAFMHVWKHPAHVIVFRKESMVLKWYNIKWSTNSTLTECLACGNIMSIFLVFLSSPSETEPRSFVVVLFMPRDEYGVEISTLLPPICSKWSRKKAMLWKWNQRVHNLLAKPQPQLAWTTNFS